MPKGAEAVLLPLRVESALKEVRMVKPVAASILRAHCEEMELARTDDLRILRGQAHFFSKAAIRGSSLVAGKNPTARCAVEKCSEPALLILVDGHPVVALPNCCKHA